jgi:ribosome biogenesis SPOUT family RNA methylase Rps3
MNERIKELAESCTVDFVDGRGVSLSEIDVEKFAELIVEECINIAYEYDKPKLSGPGLAIASNIESHFDIYIEEDGRFVK